VSPNAGLTDEQKERNRLRWLLTEAAARTSTPVTVGIVDAMARAVRDIMAENMLVLVWLSDFERDAASDDPS
jgi:hypothetical protein